MKRVLIIAFLAFISLGLCSCDSLRVAVFSAQATFARNSGQLEKAETLYKKIIDLQPDVPEHYWELGTLYISANKRFQARQQLEIIKKMGRQDLAETLQKFIDLRP